MHPVISIILPCFNPSKDWEVNVLYHYKHISDFYKNKYDIEIVLVNDGSNLSSKAIPYLIDHIPLFKYISLPTNFGKGYALRKGAAIASGTYTVLTDIDFPYTLTNLITVIEKVEQGADISWVIRDNSYYDSIPLFRKVLSKLLQFILKISFNMPYTDTQGGLKALSIRGKNILLHTIVNRYLYDIELIRTAFSKKLILTPTIGELRSGIKVSSIPLKILVFELFSLIRFTFFHKPI